MNYNDSKLYGKLMWIIYILIGLYGLTYITKQQNKLPIIDETELNYELEDSISYEIINNQDISTEKELLDNKRSYIYEVEVMQELTTAEYDSISNEIISAVKSSVKQQNKAISINNIQIDFIKDNKNIYNYLHED